MNQNDNHWQTQKAKAHFSEVIQKAIHQGDQFITYHGEEVAVIISRSRYHSLLSQGNSLIDFFYDSPCPEIELCEKRNADLPRDFEL